MIRHCIASRHCDKHIGCDIKHSRADGSLCLIAAEEDAGTDRKRRISLKYVPVTIKCFRGAFRGMNTSALLQTKIKTSANPDSNQGPSELQSLALPLSYPRCLVKTREKHAYTIYDKIFRTFVSCSNSKF
jgi:hypothetical protein